MKKHIHVLPGCMFCSIPYITLAALLDKDGLGVLKPDGEHNEPDVPCVDDPYVHAALFETEEWQAAVVQPP